MLRIAWLRKRFEAPVDQGLGEWMGSVENSDLGGAVFAWHGQPSVQVFENGFTYGEGPVLKIRYEDLVGLDLLDLRSLMMAQRVPSQEVEFSVSTRSGNYLLRVPLLLYTTLSGVLNAIVGENNTKQ
jgi:hypothetical protein